MIPMLRPFVIALTLASFAGGIAGCTAESIKKRYILAEKLWGRADYSAAVEEFEKVSRRDPRGKLGLQALYRAATTQTLFLAQHAEAIKKFKAYVEAAGGTPEAWTAQLQIGEILFSKLNAYDEASFHYRSLLQRHPDAPEAPELLFRLGRCHFFLWEFSEAIQKYEELQQKYPKSPWAERAAYETALALYTSGEQQPDDRGPAMDVYRKAAKAYQDFIRKFPHSALVPEAKFGIANCLEELDQLDAAYEKYFEIRMTYPSPKIVEVKLARLRERQNERRR